MDFEIDFDKKLPFYYFFEWAFFLDSWAFEEKNYQITFLKTPFWAFPLWLGIYFSIFPKFIVKSPCTLSTDDTKFQR